MQLVDAGEKKEELTKGRLWLSGGWQRAKESQSAADKRFQLEL